MAVEPLIEDLGGNAPGRIVRRLFFATRPRFLGASVLPVLLGTAWGWRVDGPLDVAAFILMLAAVVAVHGGANVLNDVHDDADDSANVTRIYPYTGGSRFIQNGVMDARTMARWAWTLLGVGLACGIALTLLKGLWVIAFGLAGLALGVLYSMPPVRLSARGLGVATVGIAFGLLPVTGAVWVQSGSLDPVIILLSLAVSLWIADILLINQVPDIRADADDAKRTLAVRLGNAGTGRLYLWIQGLAVVIVMAAAALGDLPIWTGLLPLTLLVPACKAASAIIDNTDDPVTMKKAIETTIVLHGVGTLWLGIVVVLF